MDLLIDFVICVYVDCIFLCVVLGLIDDLGDIVYGFCLDCDCRY